MKKRLVRYTPSEAKKLHYKQLYTWLKGNPEIEFKKLHPFGFSINIATVPISKADEFIAIVEFKEK